ncbi:MAG TPA: multiheme c-type cytochrome [Vicinamibacteria bacterium]|nr:multiheme c-type cytochrome [Vicinamibacteria bacterium]
MGRARIVLVAAGVAAVLSFPVASRAQAQKQPIYVGARACARCHEGREAGNQYSHWLATAHSQAWAALALPEAKAMARLAGILDEPEKTPICLGCHATAADSEKWERDPAFRLEDGVQCEKCHGPGSEYMDEKVMKDKEAARRAGLRRFTKRDCAVCHYVKGSHAAVHQRPAINVDEAWERLAHPVPKGSSPAPNPAAELTPATAPGPKYVGSHACGACHQGPSMGYQLSLWRLGPHAQAYAVLSTAKAGAIAKAMGVSEEPQLAPACLKCHVTGGGPGAAVTRTYDLMEGVGCESCHGAGSEYMSEPVMRDRPAAKKAGLRPVTQATCAACHAKAHGKPFDFKTAKAKIAHPLKPEPLLEAVGRRTALAATSQFNELEEQYGSARSKGARVLLEELQVEYKNPINLAFTPDGREVWVACESSGSVIVVDAARRVRLAEIPVGSQATGVAFSPDGRTAYVTARRDDALAVVDVASRKVVKTIPVSDEPHGVAAGPEGKAVFVMGTGIDAVSVIDLASGKETKRLAASRYPWAAALSPDRRTLLVTNALSRLGGFRTAPVSEVTALDVSTQKVTNRMAVPEANLLLGIAWHPSGEYALATLNRTKNLVPMTRILQGWTITNGLAVVWKDGRVDQVLLDQPQRYFADVTDVAFTPDGSRALVTSAGTNLVAVIDTAKLVALVRRMSDAERRDLLPNWLGASAEFVVARVPVKDNPRGIAVAPDGATAWVANTLDDSLSVIDVKTLQPVTRVDLGGPRQRTHIRWGERLFHSADITFQRQFACATCHPDGHVDGLTYDIEADGIGVNPVDNRTLRGIYDTDPFKWEGTNPTLARQCGARLAVFFTRLAPFDPEQLRALNDYTVTIPRPPNRYRALGAPLTEAQRRGKILFERSRTNDGREIANEGRCVYCHFPPYFTDRQQRDVGTNQALDTHSGKFDVPHLNNIYDSAPYLHNGMANTLEEIWTMHNPYDKHGVTNDMTKDQLNDLIEYLKTL